MKQVIFQEIEQQKKNMTDTLISLISIPAITPQWGGNGESSKASFVEKVIIRSGLPKPEWHNITDDSGIQRPNLICRIPGKNDKRLWIVTHLDVVPEGDLSLWETDPFKGKLVDGKIYGRGSNDNGQEMVASIFAAAAVKKLGLLPDHEICLCFVSDEENGSTYGIKHLLDKELFDTDDNILVPDSGNENGSLIEIAEKGVLRLQFEVSGKQSHAASPHKGLNACMVSNLLSCRLYDAFRNTFTEKDDLYNYPFSTFEPTQRFQNVENPNTVPGRECFFFDCRFLPSNNAERILGLVENVCQEVRMATGGEIYFSVKQQQSALSPVSENNVFLGELHSVLKSVYPFNPEIGGVGGTTCASFFRKSGLPAIVWSQAVKIAHQPNEYALVEHMINEAKVFALLIVSNALDLKKGDKNGQIRL